MKAKYLLVLLVACGGSDPSTVGGGGSTPDDPGGGASAAGTSSGDPQGSSSSSSSSTGSPSATGGPTTTADGLFFAVVGDTRPPTEGDIGGYPTSIIGSIYADVAKRNPQFVIGTGDYQYAPASGTSAGDQMDLYMKARAQYGGAFYPVMGNHECTGYTASNCGSQGRDGLTANYDAFLTKMLGPIGKTDPYYTMHVASKDGSWTAKFVFLALNAWSDAQASWLETAMSEATTYTFVVHHEPASETQAPGQRAAQQVLSKHPYTLALVGHTHTYRKPWRGSREVVVGNGGAPATGEVNYGYGLFQRRADGTIQADMIDYQTGQPTPPLAFAVNADGTEVP